MKLKGEIVKKIRRDKRLRAKMILKMDTTPSTLYRWLKTDNIMLTTAIALDIISNYLNVDSAQLIEKEPSDTITI